MSPEVCPPQPLAVQAQRQRGVCLKAALVKLIKHHCAHTPQLRVLQQPKCRFVLVSTALLYIRQTLQRPHFAARGLAAPTVQQSVCLSEYSSHSVLSSTVARNSAAPKPCWPRQRSGAEVPEELSRWLAASAVLNTLKPPPQMSSSAHALANDKPHLSECDQVQIPGKDQAQASAT